MIPFSKKSKIMNIDLNWTHIRLFGLRIEPFESQRCYQSNWTPPDPQNCHKKFKISHKSKRPNREKSTLNYSVNRISVLWKTCTRIMFDSRMTAILSRWTQTRHVGCYLSRKPGRYPSESNKISIFYLTRKGSGQASDSNSISHALSESSGMQTVPYPAIGYPYNPIKPEI